MGGIENDLGRSPNRDLAIFHRPIEFGPSFDDNAAGIPSGQNPRVLFNRQKIDPPLRKGRTGHGRCGLGGTDTQDEPSTA